MSNKTKANAKRGTFPRVMKALFRYYPRMATITIICIIFNAIVSSLPAIFMQNIFSVMEGALAAGQGWAEVGGEIVKYMLILIGMYVLSVI